jgi:exosortase/archaeosortase family protein
VSLFLDRCGREPAILVIALTLLAVSFDYAVAPPHRTSTPIVVSAFLLCLLVRRLYFDPVEPAGLSFWAPWRLVIFVLLHLGLAGLARSFATQPEIASQALSVAPITAIRKFLVIVPSFVLLPRSGWQRVFRLYRAEWVATSVALATFAPYRIFAAAWPVYSRVLAHFVQAIAGLFVPDIKYQDAAAPILMGPVLDVVILPTCSGIDGILLFQLLYALLIIADWYRLGRRRALIGYFVGIATMLLANALRIAGMVVIGNRLSPELVLRYHLNAGWIFFASVFLFYLLASYPWLVRMDKSLPTVVTET